MTKTRSIIAIAIVAVLAIIGMLVYRQALAKELPSFRYATIQRGSIQSKVSATGTLGAVTTVSVGTQVSGQVSDLYVDFNDHVAKGQLLARIDPTLAKQGVADAEANLEKARAQELQAGRDYKRNGELMSDGLVARSAYEQTQSTMSVAQADAKSAEIALQRANQNLAYTSIYSPIDGVIVERNVQKGQTVAASLSAPQLFLIANDLAHMQILAQVGESDIDQIKQGQAVDFTVQALSGRTFHGTVNQVRLQSTTQDNVVDYTVVIGVENPQGLLLPGMTARVDFLTQAATDVLEVPNAALRYHPSDDLLAQFGAKQPAKTATTTSATTTAGSHQGGRGRGHGDGSGKPAIGTLYYVDAQGRIATAHARIGVTDGFNTAIYSRDLREGMKIIVGTAQPDSKQTAQSSSSTPFGGGSQQRQGGARGGF